MRVIKPKKSKAGDSPAFDGFEEVQIDSLKPDGSRIYKTPEVLDQSNNSKRDLFEAQEHEIGRRSEGSDQHFSNEVTANGKNVEAMESRVYERGLYLLSMREHSEQELRRKLTQKFPSYLNVDGTIKQLLNQGLLSDDRFTEAYTRQRKSKGIGPNKLTAELLRKGISDDLIDAYVTPCSEQWYDIAVVEYHKKYGESPIESYKEWSKRARFLQGKGFNSSHIQRALPNVVTPDNDV